MEGKVWFGLPKETGTKFDALNELLFTFGSYLCTALVIEKK